MLLTCGACGKTIEIESDLMEGQHVRCPFCGEKTAFSKPARIELPTGARPSVPSAPPPPPAPAPVAAPRGAEAPNRPKLGIRRPVQDTASGVDLNAEAIRRNMQNRADEQVRTVQRARRARTVARRQALLRWSLFTAVLLIVAAAGVWGVVKWRGARRVVREAERRRVVAEVKKREQADGVARAERARVRAEQERERAAVYEKRQEERRKREAERAEQLARNAAERKLREEVQARYRAAERTFRNALVLPWRMLPVSRRPGSVVGTFTCAIPGSNGAPLFFEVVSAEAGRISVGELLPEEPPRAWTLEDYEERVAVSGALVHDGKDVYVLPPKARAQPIPVPEDGLEPMAWRLGDLDPLVNRLGAMNSRLKAELSVLDGEKTLCKVSYASGKYLSRSAVQDLLRPVADALEPKPKAKRSRVTVELYDGNVIKRGLRKTFVPRSPLNGDQNWQKLHDEALRQQRELEPAPEALEKRARNVEARVAQLLGHARLSVRLTAE